MWFKLGSLGFYCKKILKDERCDLFLTDIAFIWHKSLSYKELFTISQKLNPFFEASEQKIKELTLNLFNNDEKVNKEILKKGDDFLLKLETKRMEIIFKFEVKFTKGDAEMFYKEFTSPLVSAMIRMQIREKELLQIIKNKDAEIREHKKGSPETKKIKISEETVPFFEGELEHHETNTSRLDINLDSRLFSDHNFLPGESLPKIKKENVEVKKEDSLNEKDFKSDSRLTRSSNSLIKFDHEVIREIKKSSKRHKIRI